MVKQPGKLRETLGYLPQEFGVYPRVSAYALLDHLAVLKGFSNARVRKEQVEGLLAQVNLWGVRKRAVAGFSGGMRQRFGIAQALLGNPALIIVDEPTAGLDPEERNRFNNLLAEIGENVVVILSTHIVDDVADLCARMAIINDGKIVLEGTPSALMDALKGRIWRRAVEQDSLAELQGRFNVISNRLAGGRRVVHVLADSPPGAGFEPVHSGLEDLYFVTLSQTRRSHQPA